MDAEKDNNPVTVLSQSPKETSAVLTREEEIDQHVQLFNKVAPSPGPPQPCWHLGIGLGPISLEFFVREKWPLRNLEDGVQYRKFAQLMFMRIAAGESNNVETGCFCEMFGTLEHWLYMIPLLELFPENREHGPSLVNEQMTILVKHVHKILYAKEQELFEPQVNRHTSKEERSWPFDTGAARGQKSAPTPEEVLAETRQKMAKILFGPKGVADPTPTMTRFLKSWVELAYPEKVVQETMDKHEKTGKVMSRDSLGLPRGIFDSSTRSHRGVKPHGSNTHNSGAQQRLAPVTVELPDHRRGPMTKGSFSEPPSPPKSTTPRIPPGFTASDARHAPKPDNPDSPPDSLLEQLTEEEKKEKSAPGKTQTDPGKASGSSFAAFEKRAPVDYGRYARPITKGMQMVCQVKKVGWSPCTKTKTGNGMLVTLGFDKPSPAKGRAMLKDIDETAARYALMSPDEPIMLCKSDPAKIRRQPSKTFLKEMKHVSENGEGVGHLSADKTDMKLEDMELPSSEETDTVISFS